MDTAIPDNDKKKRKRPAQGKRKHLRRLKQEARKAGISQAELKRKTG